MKKWALGGLLAVLAGLAVGQQSRTSREYYGELKQGGGIPKWATMVCFTDSVETGVFILLAGNASSRVVLTQTFINSTKADLISYEKVQDGQYVAQDGSTTVSRLSLTWETGRFWRELHNQNRTHTDQGNCEPIEGARAGP